MAALLALMFAWCYAELGRAHSTAGGEYVYAKRVFGGLAGYATFLTVLASMLFIPPVLAAGAATYLNNALGTGFDTQSVALVIVVASYALGILNIRLNAWITGLFLICEVAALLVIVALGLGNASQPAASLLRRRCWSRGPGGGCPWALVLGAVGMALFAFNGYGGAVLLAEDMKDGGRTVHRAVLWSLVVVVAIEVIPLAALLIGAPSLEAMLASGDPIGYLLTAHGNETLARLVSAGIFLSVFNAIVAIVIQVGRVVYSSGRDAIWTPALNRAFTVIHPRWESPAGHAVPRHPLGLAELDRQPRRADLVHRAVAAADLPGGGRLRPVQPGTAPRPRTPVPHAAVAVAGAAGRERRRLAAGDPAATGLAARPLIILGLLAVSVILYSTHGRLSPTFQKL
jgi:amino acid transporter